MRKLWLLPIITAFLISGNASAFDNEITHPKLTGKAIDNSGMNQHIVGTLNLSNGTETFINGLKIRDWLMEGSKLEDVPDCRASNHFHNPLKPWTESYMSDQPWYIDLWCSSGDYSEEKSAVCWATGYTEPAPDGAKPETDNQWDWDHAREHYYTYLTGKDLQGNVVARTSVELANYFAKSLQSLGQVAHLLQDMAVPAHVRNDFKSHLDWAGITPETLFEPKKWVVERFEYYVERHPELIMSSSGGNLTAPTLTKFWDADNYDGQNPGISLDAQIIGLSEYTNINFASKNTVFAEDFLVDSDSSNDEHYQPYPRKSSTNVQEYIDKELLPETVFIPFSNVPDMSYWIKKTGDGESLDHFVKPGYYTRPSWLTIPWLTWFKVFHRTFIIDDKCCDDYAKKLLPQAIGYSAALLDYFFRGRLDITHPDRYLYGIADPATKQFNEIKLKLKNTTPDEEMGSGELTAVMKYRLPLNPDFDPVATPPLDTDYVDYNDPDNYAYSVSQPIQVGAISSAPAQEFTFTFSNPMPTNAVDISLMVVYQGKLGLEKGAVVAQAKDLCEPHNLRFWNATDYFCLNGTLHTPAEITDSDELRIQLDTTGNGEPDIYYFASPMNIYITFSGSIPVPEPTETAHTVAFNELPPGNYGEVV
ncbi:MAG: hypothetical protein ABIF87_11695, partial [Pseudomonadota bacterium]